jgi:TRAP transporter 4TM/12TM fusion protein
MIAGKEFFALTFTRYAPISIGVWLVLFLVLHKLDTEYIKNFGKDILDALKAGARNVLGVAIACGMAGMIVGSVTLTGIGQELATGLGHIAGGNIYLLMFFTMLSSIILGMGVPTTANYLITSMICAPALITLLVAQNPGLTAPTQAMVMSAHLFVFYFGIVADITPPVALAAMAGSAIAKGDPFKTGVTATRIAIGAFIVPYIFVLNPAMLMFDVSAGEIILNVCTALLGMYSLSGGLAGFVQDKCTWYERLLLVGGGLCMIIPGIVTDLLGLCVLVFVFVTQKRRAGLK